MSMISSPSSNGAPDGSDVPAKWRFTPLAIPELVLVETPRFSDARGWFSQSANRGVFVGSGIEAEFVQSNVSFSADIRDWLYVEDYATPPCSTSKSGGTPKRITAPIWLTSDRPGHKEGRGGRGTR
jgi:hypothetical protein